MVSQESKTSSFGSENGSEDDQALNEADADARSRPAKRRRVSRKRPLDETTLKDLALYYVGRFATTAAKLEGYLARKIRERGVAEDADGRRVDLDVPGLVARLVELGYVDDDSYARSKSRDLSARGYGKRRVEQALWAAGIQEDLRETHSPDEASSRRAAMLLAKKRRLGPFAHDRADEDFAETPEARTAQHKKREKQVAAMLRAGHLFEHIQFILEAANPESVEEWVIEAEEENRDVWR